MSVSERSAFAERVRRARREAALTQNELAEVIGYSGRAVQTWEQGERTPRAHALREISKATNKPLSWFFMEEGVAA